MSWRSKLVSACGAAIAVPFLLLASLILLPAAILSTGAAAFALTFRAAFIYIELGLRVATDYISGRKPRTFVSETSSSTITGSVGGSAARPKSVRSFASSTSSQVSQQQQPATTGGVLLPPQSAPPYMAPNPSPFVRDFEGIGGWRIAATAEDDDSDDQQWLTMNSRLELPAVSAVAPEERNKRRDHHHHRRSTAGAVQVDRAALRTRNLGGNSSRPRPASALISGRSTPDATAARDASGRVKSLTQIGMGSGMGLAMGSGSGTAIVDGGTLGAMPKTKRKGSTSSSGSQNTLVM